MVELFIDNREKIKNLIIEKIPDAKLENLSLGDYIYKIDQEDFIIIERKTISDYAASIQDGRNREQKSRLLGYYPKNRIIYIVEGPVNKNNTSCKYNKINADTIISSIINTIFRDEIQVFHTSDSDETVFLLESIYKKLVKQGKKFLENKVSLEESIIKTNKLKKGDNLTPKIVFKMMLNCIPGVSNKISERIGEKFPNLYTFIESIKSMGDKDEMEKYLINLKMDDTEKGRKIPKNIAKNILEFLDIV